LKNIFERFYIYAAVVVQHARCIQRIHNKSKQLAFGLDASVSINQVALRRARLVLGWLTICWQLHYHSILPPHLD